jgi:predicted hydrocarbon binding protein
VDLKAMVSIEKGLVVVAGERSVLIPPSFITMLHDKVIQEKGEKWRRIFYEAGKKALEEIAPTYKMLVMIPRNSETSKKKLIQGLVEIWSWMSCGRPEVTKTDFKRNKFTFRLHNSVIAKPYIGRGEMMCDYFAGVIAGGFSSLLGVELKCKEVKCIAKGDEFCEFEIEGV